MDSQSEFSVFPDLNESDMSLFELNNLILCVSLCVCVCMSVWRPPLAAWRVMSMSWASCSQPGGGNQTRQQRPQAGSLKARRTPSPLNLDGTNSQLRFSSKNHESRDGGRRWPKRQRQTEREGEWWRGEGRWRVFGRQKKKKGDKEKCGAKPQMEEKEERKDGRRQTNGGGKTEEIGRGRKRSE